MSRRVYLDNAATTFPKPPAVLQAMLDYATRVGASPGRGQYAEAREGERVLRLCRQRLATFFGAEGPERIVFTLNTSDALNLAIRSIAAHRRRAGLPTHVVASAMDHNSVLRPLNGLAPDEVSWTCARADADSGEVDVADVDRSIGPETALVCVAHGSNVSGTLQPIEAIARVCKARGVPLLVDAAQSLGHVPIDVRASGIDLLAFPGHKGLLGPQGTGGLYVRTGLEARMARVREGGTGSWSELDDHPDEMPTRFEAGSHNTMGLAGLRAGVEHLLALGAEAIRAHEIVLMRRFIAGLADLEPSFRMLGPRDPERRVAVFSLVHESLSPPEVAGLLESRGILCRAGIHCAPRAHSVMGTLASGGATRLSFGVMNDVADVDAALEALHAVARQPASGCGATSTH